MNELLVRAATTTADAAEVFGCARARRRGPLLTAHSKYILASELGTSTAHVLRKCLAAETPVNRECNVPATNL